MSYTATDHDAVLKDWYTDERIQDLSAYHNPFFGMVKKEMQGGRKYVQPIDIQLPGGGSASYAKSRTNQTKSLWEAFELTRVTQYQLATVGNHVIRATQNDRAAFLPAFKEFDRAFRACGDKIARQMFRTTGGSIGRISTSTTLAGADIVLTDPADAFNFYVGQLLTSDTVDGGGTETDSGDTLAVTAVDVENGIITVAENIDTVSGIAHGDYLFTDGDYGACMAGLASWLPVDRSVLSTPFYGVTRSTHEDKLGGIYLDASAMQIDEAIIKLVAKVHKHGGMVDRVLGNPETLSDLQLLWNGKRQMTDVEARVSPVVGYPGFKVNVPGGGAVEFYSDRNCPSNRLYALQMDTWTLYHAGECPGFLLKGLGSAYSGILLPVADADDWESRIGGYFNLGCSAPGFNGVAKLA